MFSGVSVVIPAYQSSTMLSRCIYFLERAWSLLSERQKSLMEVIVVDDGSLERIHIPPATVPIRLVRLETNRGVGTARNLGASKARFSHVLFLDSDVLMGEHFFSKLLGRLESNPNIEVIQALYGPTPANPLPSLFHKILALTRFYDALTKSQHRHHGPVICSGSIVFAKTTFENLGGFSQNFKKSGGEEFELAGRLNSQILITDLGLEVSHFSDNFFERVKKLLYRSRHYLETMGGNKNMAIKVKAQMGSKAALAFLVFVFTPMAVIHSWFFIGALVSQLFYFILEWEICLHLVKKHPLFLALMTVLYRQFEFAVAFVGICDSVIRKYFMTAWFEKETSGSVK